VNKTALILQRNVIVESWNRYTMQLFC